MLVFISLTNFIYGCLGITCLYYLVVIPVYYRPELMAFFTSPKKQILLPEENEEGADAAFMPAVHDCMQEVNELFDNAKQKKFFKEELLFGLQKIFQQYPQLAGTHFQTSFESYIINAAAEQCSLTVDSGEASACWKQ